MMKLLVLPAFAAVALSAAPAHAQAQIVPTEVKTAEKTDVEGWNPFLTLTGTLSLASNMNVVGQVEGFSTLFGAGVTGGADYVKDKHLFRSTLTLNEGFARTPVVDKFTKTTDTLKIEGLYNYFLTKDLGLYGRLELSTSAFPADDIRGLPTTWVEKNAADPTMPIVHAGDAYRQRLAGSFSPFTINESAGGFAEPIHKKKLNLSIRVGLGGRHTFADGVLLIDDDKATPEVELLRLADVHQLGVEAFAGANGKTKDERASYRAGLSMLFPFVNNDKFDRGVGTLTRIGIEGQLTFNVYKWMGLAYTLNITRDAQLFPKGDELVQIQNTLLLTFQYTAVKKKAKDPEPTAEQLELDAAKKRADDAEKRAADFEKKLQDLQTAPPAPAPAPAPTP